MSMGKEDIKLLPLAAVGITLGVMEYYVKPAIVHMYSYLGDLALREEKTQQMAAIYYFPETPRDDEPKSDALAA